MDFAVFGKCVTCVRSLFFWIGPGMEVLYFPVINILLYLHKQMGCAQFGTLHIKFLNGFLVEGIIKKKKGCIEMASKYKL